MIMFQSIIYHFYSCKTTQWQSSAQLESNTKSAYHASY